MLCKISGESNSGELLMRASARSRAHEDFSRHRFDKISRAASGSACTRTQIQRHRYNLPLILIPRFGPEKLIGKDPDRR
jgi:hypothetical protein